MKALARQDFPGAAVTFGDDAFDKAGADLVISSGATTVGLQVAATDQGLWRKLKIGDVTSARQVEDSLEALEKLALEKVDEWGLAVPSDALTKLEGRIPLSFREEAMEAIRKYVRLSIPTSVGIP